MVTPRPVVAVVATLFVVMGSAVPASAVMVPAPGAAADPSVVPQRISHPGEPGYNIIPASQFHPTSSGANLARPSFRGGMHSHAPDSTGAAPASPRTSTPSSPRINIANGTFNRVGLTAATTQLSTPPDSTGAMGTNHYVEIANSSIAFYDRNSNLSLVGSESLWHFAGYGGLVSFCDPQIQWDPVAFRWLISFLYCGPDPSHQGFIVGWSKSVDDANVLTGAGWCLFALITGTELLDFPKLGHSNGYMIVGGNSFANPTTNNPTFTTSTIYWIPLPANGDATCTAPSYSRTTATPLKNGDGVTNTFTPVPVNTDNSAANGYILSAYDASGSNGQPGGPRSKISVWHLDATGVLHTDSDVTVNSYTPPSSAPQPGTSLVLDTLPGMFTQAVGDPATGIWAQHTVAGPGGRSQVDWYEFTASGVKLALTQQGTISSPTDWVFNAAISPRFDALGAAIDYNRSSPTLNPVIAAQIRYSTTAPGTWAAGELILATSPAADTDRSCNVPAGAPCRWGDYAAATPDPFVHNLVWGTSEFNTASTSNPAWSDEIFAIVPTPEAPNTVRAYAGRKSSARVSWTPGAFDPLCPITSYTVKVNPGSATMTVAAPTTSVEFTGLTFDVSYFFTVFATCSIGKSLDSASNTVKIGDPSTQSGPVLPTPPRDAANQSAPVTAPPTPR